MWAYQATHGAARQPRIADSGLEAVSPDKGKVDCLPKYRPKVGTTRPEGLMRGASFADRIALSKALGGAPYKGISYNAATDYVVLAPGGSGVSDHNYKNRWLDQQEQRYLYFGEWNGCGDMQMRAGNLAIRERSPRLYVFLDEADAHVYEGRFRYEGHRTAEVVRPKCGHRHNAILFTLVRVG
jgi:hypothetical protein